MSSTSLPYYCTAVVVPGRVAVFGKDAVIAHAQHLATCYNTTVKVFDTDGLTVIKSVSPLGVKP